MRCARQGVRSHGCVRQRTWDMCIRHSGAEHAAGVCLPLNGDCANTVEHVIGHIRTLGFQSNPLHPPPSPAPLHTFSGSTLFHVQPVPSNTDKGSLCTRHHLYVSLNALRISLPIIKRTRLHILPQTFSFPTQPSNILSPRSPTTPPGLPLSPHMPPPVVTAFNDPLSDRTMNQSMLQ